MENDTSPFSDSFERLKLSEVSVYRNTEKNKENNLLSKALELTLLSGLKKIRCSIHFPKPNQ